MLFNISAFTRHSHLGCCCCRNCEPEPNTVMRLTGLISWGKAATCVQVLLFFLYHGHILWLLHLTALPAQLPLSTSCSYQPNFQPSMRMKPCVTYYAPYVGQHSRDTVNAKYFAKRMADTRNIEQWNSVRLLTQGCGNKKRKLSLISKVLVDGLKINVIVSARCCALICPVLSSTHFSLFPKPRPTVQQSIK